jgi:hypothetical protein
VDAGAVRSASSMSHSFDRLFNVKELMRLLGISRSWVYDAAAQSHPHSTRQHRSPLAGGLEKITHFGPSCKRDRLSPFFSDP